MSTNVVNQQEIKKAIDRMNTCNRLLMEAGLTEENKQRVINDPEFRSKLVEFWQSRYKAVTVGITEPTSLLDLRGKYGTGPNGFHETHCLCFGEKFATEKIQGVFEVDFEKQLIRKTFQEQSSELPVGWEMPHPTVLSAAYFKHLEETGERFLSDFSTRTSKETTKGKGDHILIRSSLRGLVFVLGCGDDNYSDVGVAPQREKGFDTGKSFFHFARNL